ELLVFIKPVIVKNDGTLPVQMRIRELEERRQSMYMQPMEQPAPEKEKKTAAAGQNNRRGNKYVR
ncbi:MAG: hypothetical protein HY465_01880, partial [Deltaproteobacteria bacterium]|nr:hypothetical protein [Deltaproteobacteria bacterium]